MLLHTYVWHSRPCHLTEIVPGVVRPRERRVKEREGGEKNEGDGEREKYQYITSIEQYKSKEVIKHKLISYNYK